MTDRSTLPRPPGAMPPMVSIHLPICDPSPNQLRRMLAQLALLDYPAFEVLVVDYDTADPRLWEAVARDCARLDARFRFFHLGRWPGGQAGALNFARTRTAHRVEFIAVLDPDIVVPRRWLDEAVPKFGDPWIGAVRSPCIVRKDALDSVGGWAEWCFDEAAALDLALMRKRWHLTRMPQRFDRDTVIVGAHRLRVARLAYGAAQIGRRHWRPLLSPFNRELTIRQRWRVIAGWLPWMADASNLAVVIVSLALSACFAGTPPWSATPILLCMLPPAALLALRLARIRSTGAGAAVAGLALSHSVGKAVWGALLNRAPPRLQPGALREEPALLLLTWVAAGGIAHAGFATWQAKLWCAMLLMQSLPYLAAVSVATMAAWRLRFAQTNFGPVARTGAGD
jgi:Glycosyl transferase family 2